LSAYLNPWQQNLEPSEGNIKQWLDNIRAKFMPIEQARA
jgi:hypothetical protein